MRDFSWKYFTMTGDVESYLLWKEMDTRQAADTGSEDGEYDDDMEQMEM
ncbi:YqzL family protein [Paenibacillus sp. y28]